MNGDVKAKGRRDESSPKPGISSSEGERDNAIGGRRGLIKTPEFGRGEGLGDPLA